MIPGSPIGGAQQIGKQEQNSALAAAFKVRALWAGTLLAVLAFLLLPATMWAQGT